MTNGHGERFLVGIVEGKAHNDRAVFVFVVVASFIDRRASFWWKKEAGSVNTVPYAVWCWVDGGWM